jgi:hypothetical protein
MVKLQRLNQLSCGLTLVALSATLGGCGLFGGGNTNDPNVKPSPQAASPQAFPSPTLPTAKSGTKVALTRPTNPDERLKVLKSGRNDPFAVLVTPTKEGAGSKSSSSSSAAPEDQQRKISEAFDKIFGGSKGGSSQGQKSPANPGSGQGQGQKGGLQAPIPGERPIVEAPKPPEPMNIQVMGIASVGGVPQAIVQAPEEPTSRTVKVGDRLSGGALFVKAIDISNPADPVVVFQQGSIAFSVGVGRPPALVASR